MRKEATEYPMITFSDEVEYKVLSACIVAAAEGINGQSLETHLRICTLIGTTTVAHL